MTGAPLDGTRVLDLGQYIAAPGAGQNLADLGADVIKVESLGGDQARSIGAFGTAMVDANNRGKRSIALDLRTPDGHSIIHELLATADVLLHNFRHGAAERLGLGAEEVTARHPHLVYGFVTGFGTRGPSRQRVGLDIAAQAEFGVMYTTGSGDGDPQRVGFAIADVLAADALTSGVLAALLQRARTGRGGVVETSLMEAIVAAQSTSWAEFELSGRSPRRKGNGQALAAPAADLVQTLDGAIVVSAYTAEKWAALCSLIGRPELVDDPRFADNPARVANRTELLALLAAAFGSMTRGEAVELLGSHGIVCGSVRSFDEIAADDDLLASGLIVDVENTAAPFSVPGPAFRIGGSRTARTEAAPLLGADTRTVLRGLDRTDHQIDELIAHRVVATQEDSP